ncbi:hypothetical protein [Haliscomenobacter sp.]|uniref:hypothetical protein n=1 Tax=Haliscomenobacter sp. TaxID=2717303 RepID=UPI003364BB44
MASNKNKLIGCLPYLLVAILLSWGMYECDYQYSYWRDYQVRPWAYNRDKNAKLLVGSWQGKFKDPDGIEKSMVLEVFVPLSDADRRKKASRSHRRRTRGGLGSTSEKRMFEGKAQVKSRLGIEDYLLSGSVGKEDFHQLKMGFRAEEEKTRLQPNFCINLIESGNWSEDKMSLQLGFAYFKADGSSFWSSSDPRHSYKTTCQLSRIQNPKN